MSEDFDILLFKDAIPLPAAPRDVRATAAIAASHAQRDIVTGELRGLALLTFHDASLRVWVLQGTPPAPIDDVVRSLAARSACDALAFIHPMPVPPEVPADRAVNVAVEAADGAIDILYALRGRHGEPGATFQIFQRPRGDVRRWLGVPPTVTVELRREVPRGPPEGEA